MNARSIVASRIAVLGFAFSAVVLTAWSGPRESDEPPGPPEACAHSPAPGRPEAPPPLATPPERFEELAADVSGSTPRGSSAARPAAPQPAPAPEPPPILRNDPILELALRVRHGASDAERAGALVTLGDRDPGAAYELAPELFAQGNPSRLRLAALAMVALSERRGALGLAVQFVPETPSEAVAQAHALIAGSADDPPLAARALERLLASGLLPEEGRAELASLARELRTAR